MKKLVFIFLFTQIVVAQGGMFGKDPIINKENWNKQRVHWGYFLGFNSLDFKFDYLKLFRYFFTCFQFNNLIKLKIVQKLYIIIENNFFLM